MSLSIKMASDDNSVDGWKIKMHTPTDNIPAEALGSWEWPMRFSPQIKGDFVVTCRSLPGLVAQGCNLQEAFEHAKQELEATLDEHVKKRITFPPPAKGLLEHEHYVRMSARHEETLCGHLSDTSIDHSASVEIVPQSRRRGARPNNDG